MMSLGVLSAAFLSTIAFILLLRPLAIRVGLVDRPGGRRKHHQGEVPLVGGIAIFLAVLLANIYVGVRPTVTPILLAGAYLLALGIADDYLGLSVRSRMLGQAGAALVIILGSGVVLQTLGDLFFTGTPVTLGWLAVPVTAFCFVGVINAMNMVDGLDGLAGGLAFVTLLALAYFSAQAGTWHILLAGPGAAATAAFLLFNARSPFNSRAKVFMGDAGSTLLGALLAAMLIDMSQGDVRRAFSPATALWIFAVPLMDTVAVITRRMLRGQSPMRPGRDHVHHILIRSGLSQGQTTALLVAVGTVLAGVGIVGHHLGIPTKAMFFAFLALFAVHLWATARAWRYVRVKRRQRIREQRLAAARNYSASRLNAPCPASEQE